MDTSERVAQFYDRHALTYFQAGEHIIQAMQLEDREAFLDYLLDKISIVDGMRLLDAGCGIAGPAISFALRKDVEIDCVTISSEEVRIGRACAEEKGVLSRVRIAQGDYHELGSIYPPASF